MPSAASRNCFRNTCAHPPGEQVVEQAGRRAEVAGRTTSPSRVTLEQPPIRAGGPAASALECARGARGACRCAAPLDVSSRNGRQVGALVAPEVAAEGLDVTLRSPSPSAGSKRPIVFA